MKKLDKRWILLILFVAAFLVRALFPDISYAFWDESIYLMHGQLFAGSSPAYSETAIRPPLLPIILAPLAFFTSSLGAYEHSALLVLAFLNALIVFPVFFLAERVFGRRTGLIAALISSLLPVNILNGRWVMTDSLGALLAFASVAVFFIGFETEKKWLVYSGGVLAALAVLMKFTNILLLLLLLPLIVMNIKKQLKPIILSVALFLGTIAGYLAFSFFRFGNPLETMFFAWQAVSDSQQVTLGFFLFLVKDGLGIFALFLAFGIVFLLSRIRGWGSFRRHMGSFYILYCVAVTFVYSFLIMHKGVARPPGIEWEAERFLLLFFLFAVMFAAYGIVAAVKLASSSSRYFSIKWPVIAVILLLFGIIFYSDPSMVFVPQMERAYTPSVNHESGLRLVTLEMGNYLAGASISRFGCLGNCPPIAYYSGKNMELYFTADSLSSSANQNIVVFDENKDQFAAAGAYSVTKEFCSQSHCVYFMQQTT